MWNFTIPYILKLYKDVIMQARILFQFAENGVERLTNDKKIFYVTSRGNNYSVGTYKSVRINPAPVRKSINCCLDQAKKILFGPMASFLGAHWDE